MIIALDHPLGRPLECDAMKTHEVVSVLRRDASFVWHAVVAVVFIGFVSLALAAALIDLLAI
jgi:hypothetical protein